MLDFSNGIHTHTQHMFGEVFFCFFSADDFFACLAAICLQVSVWDYLLSVLKHNRCKRTNEQANE